MKIESIVASAAIAMTAMVSPAVADGDTGSKEVRGFSVLSRVSADRLTDQEMSSLYGEGTIFVSAQGVRRAVATVPDMVPLKVCGAPICGVVGGAPFPDF